MENGEDGIYNLISDSKQQLFQPREVITKKDVEEIPFLKDLRETIKLLENKLKTAQGKDIFILKKALIEMRKQQYVIKKSYRCPVEITKSSGPKPSIVLNDTTSTFNEEGYPIPSGVSLLNPKVVSEILCNYARLKEDSSENFEGDTWYLMIDFDNISSKALAPYPLYERLVELKIDGLQNLAIQSILEEEFGVRHSLEYISSLWRNKIPKLIASAAEDQYLNYHYLEKEKGQYKKCGRCGEIKLAHNKYFSKNKTSKDGFYSICKDCRKTKKGVI